MRQKYARHKFPKAINTPELKKVYRPKMRHIENLQRQVKALESVIEQKNALIEQAKSLSTPIW